MPSILEIQIGLHYWQSEDDYAFLKSPTVRRAIDPLLRSGLIEERDGSHYRKSDALSHWVKALMAVPFPVIE